MPAIPLVAVVDDDDAACQATRRLIRSMGLMVESFNSAEQFLLAGRPDLTSCLVLDVQMTPVSGLQLQRHLLDAGYSIPIIFITAYPDERGRTQALRAGAVEFLSKPFADEALLQAIRSALKAGDDHMQLRR